MEKDGQPASYLYGTIHLISRKDFQMGDRLKQALLNSEEVVFEMPLDEEAMMGAALTMLLPGTTMLRDIFSPAQMDTLTAFFLDTLGTNPFEWQAYQKMKPFFLSQIYLTDLLDDAPMSFELEFKKIADSAGIPITGLETIEEQMGFIDQVSMEEQVSMTMETVRNYSDTKQSFSQMITYYNAQQLDSLYVLMNEDYGEYPDFSATLLDNRNKDWISKIDALAAGKRVFVAVGAAHLPGDNGIIRLLEQQGYTLTPLLTD